MSEPGDGTGQPWSDPLAGAARRWRQHAEAVAAGSEQWAEVVAAVERRYFNGQAVLFGDVASDLDGLRAQVRDVVATFNGGLAARLDRQAELLRTALSPTSETEPDAGIVFDIDSASERAEERASLELKSLVDTARMEALSFIGDRRAARAILNRQLSMMLDGRRDGQQSAA